MALSTIIDDAIRDEIFEVYYQPIYCVADGRFHSAEALVRLNDPTFGFVSPGLFIPEAEQSGAIIDIGTILLKKICAFLAVIDFHNTGLAYVEVNLSTEQCVRPQLAGELLTIIDTYGIEPSRMNLEITETSATFSQAVVEANVRRLAAAGFTFSLDDYGTGYSNVTRALALPFSLIKLDKSFADGLDDERRSVACARSIQMMHEIGCQVLVEGVETGAQARALADMGADYLQGYRYARPMPEAEFVSFLEGHAEAPV
jgi:EAL domain-containing protein (putative c-di-GMP-specific phosphodiesterase class I)